MGTEWKHHIHEQLKEILVASTSSKHKNERTQLYQAAAKSLLSERQATADIDHPHHPLNTKYVDYIQLRQLGSATIVDDRHTY